MEETIVPTGTELTSLPGQNLPTMKDTKLLNLTLKRFERQLDQNGTRFGTALKAQYTRTPSYLTLTSLTF